MFNKIKFKITKSLKFIVIALAFLVVAVVGGVLLYPVVMAVPPAPAKHVGLLPPQQLSILDQISKYFLASVSGSNIIVISGANELDENKKIIAEIYSKVAHQDGTYAEIQSGHYIRATFERELINTNDITLYAKGTGTVEVYKKDSTEKIMSFDIAGENTYKQILTDMSGTSDSFDLKSVGDISYDFITDPWACGDALVDPRDSQSYTTVQIGTGSSAQCWMAQNLNVGTMIVVTQNQTDNAVIEKYCYNGDTADCAVWGGLYQWAETVQYSNGVTSSTGTAVASGNIQGICPTGWHVPSDAEYTTLGGLVSGGAMKETGLVHWNTPNTDATNSSGFTGLGSGLRSQSGSFSYRDDNAYFWSSSPISSSSGWYRGLSYNNGSLYRDYLNRFYGFSVRCVQDPVIIVAPTVTTGATTGVSTTSLTGNGNVTSDGGATVTNRGFYYVTDGSNGSCTGASGGTQITAGSGTSAYATNIESLSASTYYCYRAYATNSAGTAYGAWTSFQTTGPSILGTGISIGNGVTINSAYVAPAAGWTCGSALVDSRDGQSYTTVQIGTQCWMAQNLNVGVRVAGSANQTTTCAQSNGSDIQKYCYDDTDAGCTRNTSTGNDGGLYQWNQTMCGSVSCNGTGSSQPSCTTPVQGICPIGWHVPSHYEWNLLEFTVCEISPTDAYCATQFPYDTITQDWQGTPTETVGTKLQIQDSTHFSSLLAGYRDNSGSFSYLGYYVHFWTSLDSGGTAWYRDLRTGAAQVYRSTYSKALGFSVRCLKN